MITRSLFNRSLRLPAQSIVRTLCNSQVSEIGKSNGAQKYRLSFQFQPNEVQRRRKIFSGIQPTGNIHVGNYLGAVKRWIDLQNSGDDVTYCIVDLHSITLPQNPPELRANTLRICASLLACGIDPQKSTLFLQSTVKEHAELCWILSCIMTMARLSHLPQYKEKSGKMKAEIPLGLFLYPVLQAADIMLYKSVDL